MAWLQGLAGKAEHLLNRMDQTAAETLHSTGLEGSLPASKSPSRRPTLSENASHRRSGSNASTASDIPRFGGTYPTTDAWNDFDPLFGGSMRRTASHQDIGFSANSTRQASAAKSRDSKDHHILDFLNGEHQSGEFLEGKSRSSSGSQDAVMKFSDVTETAMEELNESKISPAVDNLPLLRETIYRENQLLKNELQTLRRDSTMALSRAKRAEQDLQKLVNQVSSERQKTSAENLLKENDFMTALKAKDSQIAVLRVHLEKTETSLHGLEERLAHAEKLISVSESDSVSHLMSKDQADILNCRITELEESLNQQRNHTISVQNQLALKLKIAEDQNRQLFTSLGASEIASVREKEATAAIQRQLENLMSERDLLRQEFAEYKQKALTILQSKDELINTLKTSDGQVNEETALMELAEITAERDMLRGEVTNFQTRLDFQNTKLRENDIVYRRELSRLEAEAEEAKKIEIKLRKIINDLETSLQSQNDEVKFVQGEFARKEQYLQNKINERDGDLCRIRQQLLTRVESRPSEEELESRMRVLTENLIQKQTAIETLHTEKNALVAQMERLENRLREAGRNVPEARIDVASSSKDMKQSRSYSFLTDSFPDNEVTRRFKRVYTTVDRFSFRLGTFLRRYPLARVMVIGYMFLLHFWVLLVLLTYTPEIHPDTHPDPVSG